MKCALGHESFYYWKAVEETVPNSLAGKLGIKELTVNLMWCPKCKKVMEAYND